jgi:hypothetical protein
MRMMLKFTLPVEKGNEAFNEGSLGKTLDQRVATRPSNSVCSCCTSPLQLDVRWVCLFLSNGHAVQISRRFALSSEMQDRRLYEDAEAVDAAQ